MPPIAQIPKAPTYAGRPEPTVLQPRRLSRRSSAGDSYCKIGSFTSSPGSRASLAGGAEMRGVTGETGTMGLWLRWSAGEGLSRSEISTLYARLIHSCSLFGFYEHSGLERQKARAALDTTSDLALNAIAQNFRQLVPQAPNTVATAGSTTLNGAAAQQVATLLIFCTAMLGEAASTRVTQRALEALPAGAHPYKRQHVLLFAIAEELAPKERGVTVQTLRKQCQHLSESLGRVPPKRRTAVQRQLMDKVGRALIGPENKRLQSVLSESEEASFVHVQAAGLPQVPPIDKIHWTQSWLAGVLPWGAAPKLKRM